MKESVSCCFASWRLITIMFTFRDAEVMRLKQQKAAEKKAAAEGGAGSSKK